MRICPFLAKNELPYHFSGRRPQKPKEADLAAGLSDFNHTFNLNTRDVMKRNLASINIAGTEIVTPPEDMSLEDILALVDLICFCEESSRLPPS